MAVVRARSSPPYALIAFVFLTVISAGLAIYLGVRIGESDKKAADAQKELARVKKSSDSAFVEQLLKGGGTESALGAAGKQINNLKGLIVEDGGKKSVAEVTVDANRSLNAVGKPDGQLVPLLADVASKLKNEQVASTALRAQVKMLEDQSVQAAAAAKVSVDAGQQTVNQQKEQLTAAQNAGAQERKEKEEIATKDQADLTKVKEDAEAARRQLVLQLEQAKADLLKKDVEIRDLRNLLKRGATPAVAAAPAGHVVRAGAGTGECYIDLGQKDRVVVGLTFSVHDPRVGVRGKIDDTGVRGDVEAAGKGGIEVIEVGPTESLCRIQETLKGQSIQAGDLISNPVYQNSKNRKNHFVIFGDFDLDGDGVATPGERERVTHMISSWGGVLDDELSPQTDYLVLGARPASPSAKGEDQEGSVAKKRATDQDTYEKLIVEAKRSSVPILNVNRFLAMVGYYNTTIVR